MLNTPRFLGISMAAQKNRRLFVTVTYMILMVCFVAALFVPFRGNRIQTVWGLLFILVYLMGNHFLFGSMVKPFMAFYPPKEEETTSLRSAPRQRDPDEPDERELAVRNAAHYTAFRVAAIYGFLVWLVAISAPTLSGSAMALLTLPLLTVLWTLPQAIILWTEADVPEEALI